MLISFSLTRWLVSKFFFKYLSLNFSWYLFLKNIFSNISILFGIVLIFFRFIHPVSKVSFFTDMSRASFPSKTNMNFFFQVIKLFPNRCTYKWNKYLEAKNIYQKKLFRPFWSNFPFQCSKSEKNLFQLTGISTEKEPFRSRQYVSRSKC